MRCEICGAPFTPKKKEERCNRCLGHKTFSIVPPAPANEQKAGSTSSVYNNKKKSRNIRSTISMGNNAQPKKHSVRPPASLPSANSEDRKKGLPLPQIESSSTSALPSSVVLEEKYKLLNELGRGSMGTVFLAQDIALKRNVAVKFLLPELADSVECASRFKSEAVAMASIRNENVAQIFAFGEDKGTPYFVMEHLDGETVEHMIDAHNRRGFFIPVDDVVDVMIQSLYGLAAIHKADAVHRDIKPANIMLTVDPVRSVIMDFGLVRDVQVEDDIRTLAGTPAYIAPELVEGRPGADRSKLADIYSLGITFYELLTGSIPFGGETWVEILQKHIAEMPVFPSTRRSGLPEIFDDIVLKAMAKEPQERYQDCNEFLEDLLDVQAMSLPHERRSSSPPSRIGQSSSMSPAIKSRSRSSSSASNRAFRSTPTGSRGRLLIADSDPGFRSMVHGAAKAAVPGCRVHSATNGIIALELLKAIKPHVLVIDLSLPEINGLEIVATLHGDTSLDQTQIIIVSESGNDRDATLLESLGIKYFLTKPIDADDLSDLLRPILERPMSFSTPSGSAY